MAKKKIGKVSRKKGQFVWVDKKGNVYADSMKNMRKKALAARRKKAKGRK